MAIKYGGRIRETTTSTGPGDLVPGGVPDSTYRAFSPFLSNGDQTDVAIIGAGAFEECRVTMNAGSLVRGKLWDSSTGSRISFGAGTKIIILTLPGVLGLRMLFNLYHSNHQLYGGI